ncbi:MAG: hypothetical protein WCN87_03560 [Chlamydiota bacterium]
METLTIIGQTPSKALIEAVFAPQKGMNMMSLKLAGHQMIDQSTMNLFEERSAGLGALIGPHFHHRSPDKIPPIKDPTLFPHLTVMKERGIQEPFSHGIARYVPWKVLSAEKERIKAELTGSMNFRGILLKDLEGFDFHMTFEARIIEKGISIDLQISSEQPSVVGLHYYYQLQKGKGRVSSQIAGALRDGALPPDLSFNPQTHTFVYDCEKSCDYGFKPHPHSKMGWINFSTGGFNTVVRYVTPTEGSWQMWHPEKASFVCIEPLSAADPRRPTAKVSGLITCIEVEEN